MRCFLTGLFILLSCSLSADITSVSKEDTAIMSRSVDLSEYQTRLEQSNDPDEVIAICESALKGKLGKKDKFTLYLQVGICLYDLKDLNHAGEYLKKAKVLSATIKSDDQLGRLYNYMAWLASNHNSYNEAIGYFKVSYQHYVKSGDAAKQGNVLNSIGAMHWYQRNYAMALNYFNRAYELGEKHDDKGLMLNGLINKGIVLNQLTQYAEALDCIKKALELNKIAGDESTRASLLNNLGNIHIELKQFKSAIKYFNEALQLYLSLDDSEGVGGCHNNLGEVYLKLGDVDAALKSYGSLLNYAGGVRDSALIAMAYVNIGKAYQHKQVHLKAVSYFERALKIMANYKDPSLEAEAYLYLAKALLASMRYVQAEAYLNKSIEITQRIDDKLTLAECYNTKSDLFARQGSYRDALDYKGLYVDLKDTITDEQALVNSARMEAVYNLIEKEAIISKLEKDNISKEEDLARIKETRTLYLGISVALFGCIIFMILLYRLRRRTSLQLKEKNKELAQLNATKDKFFSIIAHDLKSPFSSLMGFAEMLCLHAETKNTKEVFEYAQVIHNSTKRLLGLVENLLQWSRTQLGTTEYKPMQIDVSIHTHNIVSLLRMNAEEKDIVISPKVEKDLVAWADLNLFSTVLRNLISNAIKFSRVGSVIYVAAKKKSDMIEVAVSDSGVGIRQENLEKLFQVDTAFSTKGTFNEKGTGIGLVLCKEFVEINKGTIVAESELEKGSTFTFTLPLCSNN